MRNNLFVVPNDRLYTRPLLLLQSMSLQQNIPVETPRALTPCSFVPAAHPPHTGQHLRWLLEALRHHIPDLGLVLTSCHWPHDNAFTDNAPNSHKGAASSHSRTFGEGWSVQVVEVPRLSPEGVAALLNALAPTGGVGRPATLQGPPPPPASPAPAPEYSPAPAPARQLSAEVFTHGCKATSTGELPQQQQQQQQRQSVATGNCMAVVAACEGLPSVVRVLGAALRNGCFTAEQLTALPDQDQQQGPPPAPTFSQQQQRSPQALPLTASPSSPLLATCLPTLLSQVGPGPTSLLLLLTLLPYPPTDGELAGSLLLPACGPHPCQLALSMCKLYDAGLLSYCTLTSRHRMAAAVDAQLKALLLVTDTGNVAHSQGRQSHQLHGDFGVSETSASAAVGAIAFSAGTFAATAGGREATTTGAPDVPRWLQAAR